MFSRLTATPRARFFLACAAGGALASVVFVYLLLEGRFELFEPEFLSSFYDVQARALLDGHWDVPARSLAWERFEIDGKFFTYFGPWPAFLRMPILAVTDRLDGQLSRLSMLLAFAILLVAVSRLCWQGRTFVRGSGMPTRGTLVAAGGFVGLVGAGSTALFLAGRTWVYHEALLWGLACGRSSRSHSSSPTRSIRADATSCSRRRRRRSRSSRGRRSGQGRSSRSVPCSRCRR